VLKLSLLGHATYFSTISFCFARLTAGRSNGRDLPSLVPRHTMLHTMPRTIMTGTSTFSGSTTGKLAVHVEVGSGRDLVAKHEHGVGQRLGARDSGSFGRGAEGSNPCFLHRRVLANLTRSIRSPKISPGGLRAAWLRESFALRCTSAGALIWLADDRCPIRPDTPGSGFESCSLQRRLGREPDFRGEEQSRRFAPRHLSVVARPFAYQQSIPSQPAVPVCPIIDQSGGTLVGFTSFHCSLCKEDATVGAILLWLLGIPIPIIILLLLLWH
jgi:hypothetical protein